MKQGRWRRRQISEVLRRAAERRYSMSKVRSSSHEEIPHVQGQRNPNKMVGPWRGHQRAETETTVTEK